MSNENKETRDLVAEYVAKNRLHFTKEQMQQIDLAYYLGLDPKPLINEAFSAEQMELLIIGQLLKVDTALYADPSKSFIDMRHVLEGFVVKPEQHKGRNTAAKAVRDLMGE